MNIFFFDYRIFLLFRGLYIEIVVEGYFMWSFYLSYLLGFGSCFSKLDRYKRVVLVW